MFMTKISVCLWFTHPNSACLTNKTDLNLERHHWYDGNSVQETKITSLPSCIGSSTVRTRTNIETESLLLPAPHECYLPACVPVQWFFATLWTVACQASLSMGFPRQEDWSGGPFPSPGDLPDPGIEPTSPLLAGRFFTIWVTREAFEDYRSVIL